MASYERVIPFESEKQPRGSRLVVSNGFYRAYHHVAFLFHSCIARRKVSGQFSNGRDEDLREEGFLSF